MTVYGRKEFPRGAARPKPTSSLLVLNYRVEDVKSNGGNQHDGSKPHLYPSPSVTQRSTG